MDLSCRHPIAEVSGDHGVRPDSERITADLGIASDYAI
jgi:hypothetical protein